MSGWKVPNRDQWAAWLADKPPSVQAAALRYPHGSTFMIEGERHWCLGYLERDGECTGLFLTPVNPFEDYDGAVAERGVICICCAEKYVEQKGLGYDA